MFHLLRNVHFKSWSVVVTLWGIVVYIVDPVQFLLSYYIVKKFLVIIIIMPILEIN